MFLNSTKKLISCSTTSLLNCVPKSSLFNNNITTLFGNRPFSSSSSLLYPTEADLKRQSVVRNIGISAHIDSGKTTLTERVLFYSGKINQIHEVRGKDGVGATMDHMDLEREKGITIQSAATRVDWGGHQLNIIDTPGHVDFTIEVERALRVLDGAVMIVCAVGGVQSQTMTVNRQMNRYNVPRIIFINKSDRQGADPFRCIAQVRSKLGLNAVPIQLPIGLEDFHEGVVDLVGMKAYTFQGSSGEQMIESDVPDNLVKKAETMRQDLLENLANYDDDLAEVLLMDEQPSLEMVKKALRQATLDRKIFPVMIGSAFKNKGVQPLLQGVIDYLPNPVEVLNEGIDVDQAPDGDSKEGKLVKIESDVDAPFVGLAFKLEENRYGQLTYLRVYRGQVKKGDMIINTRTKEKVKIPRLIQMHSNSMEDIGGAQTGDICAIFGVECNTGDTFTSGENLTMTSMHVPDPVISYAVKPVSNKKAIQFGKALNRFQREDPTFRLSVDEESQETIVSGMGELHLQIYMERMKREYGVEVVTTPPRVAYRETVSKVVNFDHTHKKQTGGAGQYARVIGTLEPLDRLEDDPSNWFQDKTVGGTIPPEYIPACQKGFEDIMAKGPLSGSPIQWTKMTVVDGAWHAVDSSELAFRTATRNAIRNAFKEAQPIVLEPMMTVEVNAPAEHQTNVIAGLNKRKGHIIETDTTNEWITVIAEVSLTSMFGYSTDLRSGTQGKGEFSMEFSRYNPVSRDVQKQIEAKYEEELKSKDADWA